MKVLNYPRTCVGCGLVLLNVFLFAATATGQLSVNPSIVNFGNVHIGTSVSQSVLLNNTGSGNLTISQATALGTGFSISGLKMPLTLAPGQSASLTTTFAPQSSGSISGSVSLECSRTHRRRLLFWNNATAPLTGTGTAPGQLTANPSSLNFANVQVGSSQTQSATLTNSGGSSLTVSQATLTGSSFTLSGLTLPLTIDNTVVSGQTYYYAATAVNSASQESGYSNQTQAIIPNP